MCSRFNFQANCFTVLGWDAMQRDRNGCNTTLQAGSFGPLHFCFSDLFKDLREGPAIPRRSGGSVLDGSRRRWNWWSWLTENVNQDFTRLIFHFSVRCQCADRATDMHLCSRDMTAVILEWTINVIVSYNLAHEGGRKQLQCAACEFTCKWWCHS